MSPKQTALITGASMGLGLDYARLCAERGMDLVLVARSRDKLEALAAELRVKHGISAYAVPCDLDRREAPREIFSAVEALGLTIDVLINNAGFGHDAPFVDAPLERELSMVHVNIESLVALTHLFANGMVDRGRGRILLVASVAGFQTVPGLAVYCGTKAFVLAFGEALAYELRGSGVTVTTHCPGATETEFARTAGNDDAPIFRAKALVASSSSCASDGFAAMERGAGLRVHGFVNWLTSVGVGWLPRALLLPISAAMGGYRGRKVR